MIANNIIGAHASTGPGLPISKKSFSQPHWKIATITPYAAPTDSMFMITAFSGTRMLRNTISNKTKLSINTAPISSARRCPR